MHFQNKLVIGVTGKFGAGKTTLCRMFKKLGVCFIEADKIVHELYKPNKIGYFRIKKYFGEDFVNRKAGVLRIKLRRVVLDDDKKLKLLNKIIHPFVAKKLKKEIVQAKEKLICIESVHFAKNNLGKLVDKIILIERKSDLIKYAMRKSKWSPSEIANFIKITPVKQKVDFVIENNGTKRELGQKAKDFFALMANFI